MAEAAIIAAIFVLPAGGKVNRVIAIKGFYRGREDGGVLTVKNAIEALAAHKLVTLTQAELADLPNGPGSHVLWSSTGIDRASLMEETRQAFAKLTSKGDIKLEHPTKKT